MKRILLLLVITSLLSGCGALFGRHDGAYTGGIYPATRFDFRAMGETPIPAPLLFVLDLPFSIITDTIMIPEDI